MCRELTFSEIERRAYPSLPEKSNPRLQALGFALIIIGTLGALACISTVIASAGSYQGWWHVNLYLSPLEMGSLVGAGVILVIVACVATQLLHIPLRRTTDEPEISEETPEVPETPAVTLEKPAPSQKKPLFYLMQDEPVFPSGLLDDLKAHGIEAARGDHTKEENLTHPCFHLYNMPLRVDAPKVALVAQRMWELTQGNCVWIFLDDKHPSLVTFSMQENTGFKGKVLKFQWQYDNGHLVNPAACAEDIRKALAIYNLKEAGHV